MLKQSPEDYFRKSITVHFLYCTLNEMKTRFTDLHARTALGLQLVPSIIENIAPLIQGRICVRPHKLVRLVLHPLNERNIYANIKKLGKQNLVGSVTVIVA